MSINTQHRMTGPVRIERRRPAALLLLLGAMSAHASFPSDAQLLAGFDLNFARCEVKYTYMRGQRDQAYANLWGFPLNAKSRAYLAGLRASTPYAAEKADALARPADDPAEWCPAMWHDAFPK